MPRMYNWIRGEGTVRNQRWGLGSVMDTPFNPGHGFGDIVINPSQTLNTGFYDPSIGMTSQEWNAAMAALNANNNAGPNMSSSFADYGYGSSFSNISGGQTIGGWIQQNATLLLVGGVVGLMLFKR